MGTLNLARMNPERLAKHCHVKFVIRKAYPSVLANLKNPASKRKFANLGPRKIAKWFTKKPVGLSLLKSVQRLPQVCANLSPGKIVSTKPMKFARLFQSSIAKKIWLKNQGKSVFLNQLFAPKKIGKEQK